MKVQPLNQKISHGIHPWKLNPLNQKLDHGNASQKKNSPMESEPIEQENKMWK
jgi:hypothetical protein